MSRENLSSGFLTSSVTNQAVHPINMAERLEILNLGGRAKTNALISYFVTGQLICAFVFPCAKSRFSHDKAQTTLKSHKCSHFSKDYCEGR